MAVDDFEATAVRPFRWSELEELLPSPPAPSRGDPEPGVVGGIPSAEEVRQTLLAEAKREASALIEAARRDAERMREAARLQGLEEGRAEGRDSLEAAAGKWEAAAVELSGFKTGLYEEARGQVVDLVLAVAGRVLGPLAEGDADAVVRVAGRALQALSDREIVTLRVNPKDLQGLVDAKPRLLQAFDGIKKLTVLEDHSVGQGGCLVETPTAEIDARLDAQLQELARILKKP